MIRADRCRIAIDNEKPLFAARGGLRLTGWCFDESSASLPQIRLVVGERTFPCEHGIARADAAAAHPQFSQAGSSGFSLQTWLPLGCHIAGLEVSSDGQQWALAKSFSICSELAPLIAELESPLTDEVESSSALVSGWALHPQDAIARLTLQMGNRSSVVDYGTERPEIGERFPDFPESSRSGFSCRIRLPVAAAPLRLHARLRSGATVVLPLPRSLVTRDPATVAFFSSIDEERAAALHFTPHQSPKVSIIIAVYNQLQVTTECLRAIQRQTSEVSYEVIVVDDHSAEPTQSALQRIRGIKLLRNETNRGFLESCNRGAEAARGEYLVFLNNDTEVRAGWLGALLRVFEARSDAGLVGAKLIYPDGRLQEAGGIIWRDATGANYGKFDVASRPQYNYLREVDYCSGACIITPKNLFHQIGGFDRDFVPAYYEDADYAFKVREAGRKVYYQPFSTVVHREGQSSGTSTESGVKRYQLVNEVKFRSKWRHRLANHPEAQVTDWHFAKDFGVSRRVLIADARMLCPDQDAGSLRMLNLIQIFQQLGFKVTFLPGNRRHHSPYTEQMQELGVECVYHPFLHDLADFFSRRAKEFDLILISRLEMGEKVLDLCLEHAPLVPVVFDTVDLHFLRMQREAELQQDSSKREIAELTRRKELDVARRCSATVVVSSYEKEVLQWELPESRIAVLATIHELYEPVQPFAGRKDFVFIGGFEHPPNVDAMLWFCAEVMPLLIAELPKARLHIIGSKITEPIRALASDHVVVHGYVEDLRPFFDSCLLSVAPLRFGAGVKGKINQSMSYGLPVVATTIAAEGMHLRHGHDVLVADEPAEFAAQTARLSREPDLWNLLSQNSLQNVRDHFSFEAAKRNLEALLGDLAVLGAKDPRESPR